jgi:hypothetical protein
MCLSFIGYGFGYVSQVVSWLRFRLDALNDNQLLSTIPNRNRNLLKRNPLENWFGNSLELCLRIRYSPFVISN